MVWCLFLLTLLFGAIRPRESQDVPFGLAEELSYLKEIYRKDTARGCGTEIKCDIPEHFDDNWLHSNLTNGLLVNSTHGGYNCCYDCSSSCNNRHRCYQGWQCCKSSTTKGNENDTSFAYLDDFMSCEQTFIHDVFNNPNWKTLEHMDISYNMVSKCPDEYGDLETKLKCSSNSTVLSLIDRMPFMSRRVARVFKNIHCVRCHNVLTNDLLIFSLSIHEWAGLSIYEVSRFETVSDILTLHVSSVFPNNSTTDRVLLTALPEDIHNKFTFSPRPCDKNGMNITSVLLLHDKESDIYFKACQMFFFPITVSYKRQLSTFKNLACALLHFPDLATIHIYNDQFYRGGPLQTCTLENTPGPRMIVNTQPIIDEIIANHMTNYSNFNSVIDIDSVLSVNDLNPIGRYVCSIGYLLDTYQNRCRKILCPHRFYIYNGKCEPVYIQTIRISYFTMIKITPVFKNKSTNHIRNIVPSVLEVISALTNMNICGHETRYKPAPNGKVTYAVLSLWLTAKADVIRYADIAGRVYKIYNDTRYKRLSSVLDDLVIGPANNIYTSPTWPMRHMYDTIDETLLRIIPNLKPELFVPSKHCSNSLSISQLEYCNRVKLAPTEFRFVYDIKRSYKTFKIVIKASGKTVYDDHYELLEDASIIMCINEYLGSSTVDAKLLSTPERDDKTLIDIYICIGLGMVVVIIIAVCVYCRWND